MGMEQKPEAIEKTASQPRVGPAIRRLRREQDMTLAELGEKAGLSIGFLSQIERELATPSLGALAQIAHALGVEVEYFITSPRQISAFSRAGERQQYWVSSSSMIYERLDADFPGSVLSAILITLPPGFVSQEASHDGEEILYQIEGTSQLVVDDEAYTLEVGDSMHFRSSQRHRWANPTDKPSKVLWTGTAHIHRRMFHNPPSEPVKQ